MEPFELFVQWHGTVEATLDAVVAELGQAPAPDSGTGDRDGDEDAARFLATLAARREDPPFSAPVDDETLVSLFGVTAPTAEAFEAGVDGLDALDEALAEPGACYHIVLHDEGDPMAAYFFGWTI